MNCIIFCIMLIFGGVLNMKKYLSSHSSAAYSSTTHQPGLILYSSHPLQHFAPKNKKERETDFSFSYWDLKLVNKKKKSILLKALFLDRGARQATIPGVAKSRMHSCSHWVWHSQNKKKVQLHTIKLMVWYESLRWSSQLSDNTRCFLHPLQTELAFQNIEFLLSGLKHAF